ncbi:glycosyltransferase [Psychroserpens sp.]|uniref:glycosyltransferase n=1 Tax=Psychroserpens sp. TaxID=2020870 RepID=UPI001B1DFA1A|nr:glycosyltransferase [Psychroserpens sp.]MBO6605713.1 glycosyltransferase [Psychroserpens sp.]MBO6652916.1 glycosyltransferase [Psychroserpens sp.]MBO6681312.1 glycosyltransferase [Psychroserpens sp.]MBO6749087.1 glycosyltransferase [Psychroserpens sp.]MBO6914467.1 glycosyltransferase [Psychroserpens sp.]
MVLLQNIFKGIEIALALYFGMSCIYVFIFSVAGHFYKRRDNDTEEELGKFAVLIPAYKEDEVIVEVAKSALLQQYPPSYFDVVVIADSLKKQTLNNLNRLQIKVIEVLFENSTKSKALNAALDQLDQSYDYALVLDADNIMEPEFLAKINKSFRMGYQIVQGHRKAKNLNTPFAILDAASEAINNHIFRRGHRALGLSSGLIGSGMAFDYKLFKSIMKQIKAVGGFDKELEFELAQRNLEIEYLQDAYVLDEKIQRPAEFSNQRRRWLATQFVYLKRNFIKGFNELLVNKNINFFDKVWQLIIPPRVILLGVTVVLTLIYVFLNFVVKISTQVPEYVWISNLIILVSTFILALPRSFYRLNTLMAMFSLPTAFFRMFMLLFKLKGANRRFIHTAHSAINN